MLHDRSFQLWIKELMLSGLNPDTKLAPLHARKPNARQPVVGYRVFILRKKVPPSQRWQNQYHRTWWNTRSNWPKGINQGYPTYYDQPFIAMGVREGKYKVWGGEGIKIQDRHFEDIHDAISYATEVIREQEWFE